MADVFSKGKRSEVMGRIPGGDNRSTERRVAALLRARGVSGWTIRPRDVYGNPDIFFPQRRIALFLDGCFWHGCGRCCHIPKNNRAFWRKKIGANKQRDSQVNRRLRKVGITVVRLWEHDIERRSHRLDSVLAHLATDT